MSQVNSLISCVVHFWSPRYYFPKSRSLLLSHILNHHDHHHHHLLNWHQPVHSWDQSSGTCHQVDRWRSSSECPPFRPMWSHLENIFPTAACPLLHISHWESCLLPLLSPSTNTWRTAFREGLMLMDVRRTNKYTLSVPPTLYPEMASCNTWLLHSLPTLLEIITLQQSHHGSASDIGSRDVFTCRHLTKQRSSH